MPPSDSPYLHVLAHQTAALTIAPLTGALQSLGHRVDVDLLPFDAVPGSADLGHDLSARWSDQRPDAVLALGWLAGLAAQIGGRGLRVPVLQRLYSPGRSRDVERRRLESAIARSATRVLALCSGDAEQLVALGVRRSAVRVVPHGVDTTAFCDEGPVWPAGDTRRLVARPADHAAAEQLIGLLPALPTCELVLLTSEATRPAVTSALTAAVARYPVASRVRLMDLDRGSAHGPGERGDPGDPAALAALLRSTDLAVVVDDDEPSLDLVLQAMATGLPVVAPATGTLADVVADGVTGVLVPPTAATALGDATRSLLGDELSRESLGLAAGDRARASFGWPTVAAAMARVAEEAMSGARPGSSRESVSS